jgi:fatty acid desaturase
MTLRNRPVLTPVPPARAGPMPPLGRHRFAPEVRQAVTACLRPDNWHGPVEIVEHWAVVVLVATVSLWCWGRAPWPVAVAAYLLAVVVIGGRQRALAGILHQAVHRVLVGDTRVGAVLGSVFGGWPVLQSFTGYRATHVIAHHGHTGDLARDPDYQQYVRNGLCGGNLNRAALARYLRRIVGPRATASYLAYLLRHRIVTADERPGERAVRIPALAGAVGVAALAGWLPLVLAYWLVPLLTTQLWIGAVAELFEHYPLIETAPRTDIRITWNRHTALAVRLVIGEKEYEGYHLVHHLFPRAPFWRLKEIDRILCRDPLYNALPRLHGFVAAVARIRASLPA